MRGVLALLSLAVLATAPTAQAAVKSVLVVNGRGYGHGVGMSQWGAYGMAQRGTGYAGILAHYYSGTALGRLDGDPEIRVLLRSGGPTATFTGATHAGDRELDPATTYQVARNLAGRLILKSPAGRKLETFEGLLRVHGAGPVVLRGTAGNDVRDGAYRGALEFRPNALRGIDAINALGLEEYVRGVVSRESPASWPADALKAQAVAARTYAITTGGGAATRGFDQFPDQRSQVYGGVSAETPTTDAAVAATSGQVVTYGGRPVVTYFFSTSGGRTENVENSFLGAEPKPWLRSVPDPHDTSSPRHRWGPIRLTGAQVARVLGGLVPGAFRGIEVVSRGASPRVVQARILGTRGSSTMSGPALRKRLKLSDSWAYFRFISSSVKKGTKPKAASPPAAQPAPQPSAGGTPAPPPLARMAGPRAPGGTLVTGQIVPARRGAAVRVQVRRGGAWRTVIRTSIHGRGGRYRATLPGPGVYRVVYARVAGPEVRAS